MTEPAAGKSNFVEVEKITLKWTKKKIFACVALFLVSFVCIAAGLRPLIEGDRDLKAFANLIFVFFHAFYMFSFSAVRRNSQFFFWALSFLMLDAMTLVFIFYDEIFF